jgi:hypothetical protein
VLYRATLIWKALVWLLAASALAGTAIWWYLLSTICRSPTAPVEATGNIFQYNCHGSIVFITLLQERLLHWLIPALFVVGIFGVSLQRRIKRT